MDHLIGYEVQIRTKTEGVSTLEWFDRLEDAKTFAFTMCNDSSQKLLGRIRDDWWWWADISLDDLEGLFIVKHWGNEGRRRIQSRALNHFSVGKEVPFWMGSEAISISQEDN